MKYGFFILMAVTVAGVLWFFGSQGGHTMDDKSEDVEAVAVGGQSFPLELSDAEWKKRLTPEQYRVLRKHGTERAFTSPLNDVKGDGVFVCAACEHELFDGDAKFDSGTGWPSFYTPVGDDAIGTAEDRTLFMKRTEVHCANCGGHLGHVFPDGPAPTGLRYCINGVALNYQQESE